ncbi:MAG TPA: SCO family protein [Sediminibacterium sp.]
MFKVFSFFYVIGLVTAFSSCQPPVQQEEAEKVLPFYTSADFTPQWISTNDPGYTKIHTIPDFQFTDQQGKKITEKTLAGKIYVAGFFFTACPGICKRLTNHLALVQKAYLADDDVRILSHSVTPDADSVARLQQYAADYGVVNEKWFLLTGNRDSIYTLARKAYFADEDMGTQKNSSDFLHTENLLLIDRHRRIRGVYKGTSLKDVNDLIADIRLLKQEE